MDVRPATLEDIPAILDLVEEAHLESPVYNRLTSDVRGQYKLFSFRVADIRSFAYVTEDLKGALIGHVENIPLALEKRAVSDFFFVSQEYRKTSRAVKLVRAFEGWAKGQDLTWVYLGISTGIDVESTLGFFEKMDYDATGVTVKKELSHE